MASLNDTARTSRVLIKYGAIALVVMIVGRFVLGIVNNIYWMIFPPDSDPPTVGFGIIPPVEFPVSEHEDISYSLETPTGTLPAGPDRLPVFKYILERPNLLALERAIGEADRLGFEDPPEQISDSEFIWTSNKNLPATFEMNVHDGTFTLQYDWTKSPGFLLQKQLINELDSSDRIKSTLKSPGLLTPDIDEGNYYVTYLRVSGRNYQEAVSLSEADFVRFDYFRKSIKDTYPVVTLDPSQGAVQALLSTNPKVFWLIYMEYNLFPIDYEVSHTYPLKPVSQAWEELQQGKGYVASLDKGISQARVRRVELGYYDAFDKQPYLQPIYIFSGDNNFVAYVPAVRDPTLSPTPVPR